MALGCALTLGLVLPCEVGAQRGDRPQREDRAPDGPVAINVMSFNIRTAAGRDGDNVWPNRKELVAETIARFDPAIVGLQEALDEQIEYLAEQMPEYRWLGIDRGLNGGRGLSEYTPIFYKHAELSPIESGNFWLSGNPDVPIGRRRGGRIVTWARFHHRETRQQIYVYNTHFTLRRGQRQVEAMDRITGRMAAHPPGSAVVLTGDFNSLAEQGEPWQLAVERGLRDTWVEAGTRRGPALTANGFGPPPVGREGRIDWILVGGSIDVEWAETVVQFAGDRFPSDHYPVVARLVVRPGP